MSAITQRNGALGPDGVHRYLTKCKVIVHSHVAGTFDISQDVQTIGTSKNLKGIGQAHISLTASYNFLQFIFPNDYINIYLDIGDGEGLTRIFFGYVDQITENWTVSDTGENNTSYVVNCSDWQKALEKTSIYQNPHIAQRKDIGGKQFGTINIGGLTLMARGVTASGSPSDVVQNLLSMLLGYGTQFMLPDQFGADKNVVTNNRTRRKQALAGALGPVARQLALHPEMYTRFQADVEAKSNAAITELQSLSDADKYAFLQEKYFLDASTVSKSNALHDVNKMRQLLNERDFRIRVGSHGMGADQRPMDKDLLEQIHSIDNNAIYSLLDIVDTHSYVESGAIDGWITSTGIWQGIGSVNQLLNNYANSDINELFYDLRPMTDVEHFNPTDYLHTPDEINGNVDHTHQSPNGIRYVPCVVMREYPYSTIPSIEGKDIRVRLQADNQSTTALVGTIPIGAIFSDQPNLPGRHEVPIKAYAVETIVSGTPKIAKKIMDVAVITTREIRSSNFSRSDADHFNLFELTSGSAQLTSMKYLTSDILPIITPIHIMRHGLRTKMVTSLFANFSFGGTVQRDSEGVATTASVASDASVEESAFSVTMTTNVVLPIEEGANNQGQVSSVYGYRPRRAGGAVTNTPQDGGNWVFHNGVDIRAAVGTPVRAIMDGLVVGSAPDGVLDSYGSTVIIKHVDTGGRVVYSQYSHLSSRTVGAHNEVTGFNRAGKAAGFSKDLAHYGTFSTEKVTAGQIIGYVGLTGDKQGTTTVESVGAHCHFEILTGAQKTIYPSGNKDFTPDVAITSDPATHVIPVGSNPRSADPIAYFAGLSGGVILNTTSAPDPSGTNTEPDGDTDSVGVPDDPAVTSDPTENANSSHSLASTDNISTRKQILRWALLQDHWYQHNMEYLSGQITMRGAPEIRVGYRLDIQDRGLSFYVEGVSHSWEFGKELITVLTVTRGQSHNPFPLYVMPPLNAWVEEPVNQRTLGSRLAQYMDVPDPTAVGNAVVLRNHHGREQFIRATDRSFNPGTLNRTDFVEGNITETNDQGVVVDGGAIFTHPVYNEEVVAAETLSTLATAQFAVFGEPPATEAIIDGLTLVGTDTETILKEMDLWIAEEP